MCSINRFFNTTYNDEPEVPPYTGIMFEVTTRAEVVIVKAFELDLRLENATDLTVEIYTLQGNYGDVVGKPENWTLIANTEVVPSVRGGGIVPVQKVVPVRIEAAQRQSFYITMKGAYLDHNVNALQKTGELQSAGEDLDIYVGAGLTDYKFSGQLDKILHPMFAGVIHYEIPYECDTVVTSTAVFEFSVLFRKSVGNRSDVTNAISDALNELLIQDPQLRTYVSDFSLVKQKGETVPLQYTRKYWSTIDCSNRKMIVAHCLTLSFLTQKIVPVHGMSVRLPTFVLRSISCTRMPLVMEDFCMKSTAQPKKSWSLSKDEHRALTVSMLVLRVWPPDLQ